MRKFLLLFIACIAFNFTQAQLLKKIKDKANKAIGKAADKAIDEPAENKPATSDETAAKAETETNEPATTGAKSDDRLKVYSKFDFVPGKTILYFDNFEKDNIGETPSGWITNTSAEVVTIDGLEGNWLKMNTKYAEQISRNKKQSWGNNFTVEFDLLLVPVSSSPRFALSLLNTGGNLVTDEKILAQGGTIKTINMEMIIDNNGGKQCRATLNSNNNKLSDRTEELPFIKSRPVHISMCVQGKRFRMWWDSKKVYDLSAINENYLPNQLGLSIYFHDDGEIFMSNIRVAKDVPDTRAAFEEGKLISHLLFFTGTAKLKPESMGALFDVSKVLKDATTPVKIIGHTDSDGEEGANVKLSQQRAEAVKSLLVKEYGISENILVTEGRGEVQPIADNKSSEGKAQNRRVEFVFKAEADTYEKPQGLASAPDSKSPAKSQAGKQSSASTNTGNIPATGGVTLQSKLLTTSLPYAQFVRNSSGKYTFMASKEEGNSNENFIKIELEQVGDKLKAETFNYKDINTSMPLYGTKKYPEIREAKAILYYGNAKKPYIKSFTPVIADGHMSKYYSESLQANLPAASGKTRFVIEKIEDGKASGYFITGILIEGLKPVTKGDAMQDTFTTGFAGEMKCTFTNVPVY